MIKYFFVSDYQNRLLFLNYLFQLPVLEINQFNIFQLCKRLSYTSFERYFRSLYKDVYLFLIWLIHIRKTVFEFFNFRNLSLIIPTYLKSMLNNINWEQPIVIRLMVIGYGDNILLNKQLLICILKSILNCLLLHKEGFAKQKNNFESQVT